jgi:hypothetical protein
MGRPCEMGITVHVAILQMYIWKTIFFAYKINYPGANVKTRKTTVTVSHCQLNK